MSLLKVMHTAIFKNTLLGTNKNLPVLNIECSLSGAVLKGAPASSDLRAFALSQMLCSLGPVTQPIPASSCQPRGGTKDTPAAPLFTTAGGGSDS